MHVKLLISLLALSLLTAACTESQDPSDKPFKNTEDIEEVAADYRVTCNGTASCNNSMAAMFTLDEVKTINYGYYTTRSTRYGVCTSWKAGTYEGKTLMATNRHCVETVIDKGGDCTSKIFFRFVKDDGQTQAFCAKLVDYSDADPDEDKFFLKKDLALIQLDRNISAPTIEIEQTKIKDNMMVSIDSIEWDTEFKSAAYKTQSCKIIQNTFANPYSYTEFPPVFYTRGCEVIKGNSGSVVKNRDNKAIGIVYGGTNKTRKIYSKNDEPTLEFNSRDNRSSYSKGKSKKEGVVSTSIINSAYSTNFACIQSKTLKIKEAPSCEKVQPHDIEKMVALKTKENVYQLDIIRVNEVSEEAAKWASENMDTFQWKLNVQKDHRTHRKTYALTPSCLVKPFNEDYSIKLPTWTVTAVTTDNVGRLSIDIQRDAEQKSYFIHENTSINGERTLVVYEKMDLHNNQYAPRTGRSLGISYCKDKVEKALD